MEVRVPTMAERALAQGAPRAVLALDLGTSTGWAIRHLDGAIRHGTLRLEKGSHPGARVRALRRWVQSLHESHAGLGRVFYEEKMFLAEGAMSNRLSWWLEGVLLDWGCLQGVEVEGVPIGTIKKHATGKGNAEKEQVEAAMQALGFEPRSFDEADALALLHLGIERMEVREET